MLMYDGAPRQTAVPAVPAAETPPAREPTEVSPAVAAALLSAGCRIDHIRIRRATPAAVVRTGGSLGFAPNPRERRTTQPLPVVTAGDSTEAWISEMHAARAGK